MRSLALGIVFAAGMLPAADFQKDVVPVLRENCIGCHGADKQAANIRLDTADGVRKATPARVLASVESGAMPPGNPKPPAASRTALVSWLREGATWPASVATLSPLAGGSSDVAQSVYSRASKANAPLAPYSKTIPSTTISFDMRPIPAGDFSMGSAGRKDEEPVRKVHVDGFWMMAHEVTWDEYRLFMFPKQAGEELGRDKTIDAVSRPTRPYVEMSFGMGITGFPAISMTQHAANKYAEWLSAKTGEFYRLPTEAEWEYACKAGSTSDVPESDLSQYAWYGDNSNGKYQKVASKKPNAWGLFDMLGNVTEWTLDQYAPYPPASGVVSNPWVVATKPYPEVARGGSWNDPAESCRCSARVGSDPSWKQQDPQLPKSIWYLTDAQWLGFRLVRPVKVPSPAEMQKYWNNGVEKEY